MVLESVIKSRFALHHPFAILFFGIVLTTISMGVSLATFRDYASILTIAFITIGGMPLLFKVFAREEKEEAHQHKNPATFLGRHFHIIQVFAYLFIGIMLAYAFWYNTLPAEFQGNLFKEQDKTFQSISSLRGDATASLTQSCPSNNFFDLAISCVFANNAMVLAWALILSFFYGAGSIFLIAWNASVVGLVIGKEIALEGIASGITRAIGLLPHGIFEVGAYFIGSIAGGMISAAIAKQGDTRKELETIGKDVAIMVVFAYLLLVVGAAVEAALILYGG